MSNYKRNFRIAMLLIVAIVLGFVLEMIKVNINYLLDTSTKFPTYIMANAKERQAMIESQKMYIPYDYYHNHQQLNFLFAFSNTDLQKIKWLVTILGTVFFLLINLRIVKHITKEARILKWTLWLYLFFFLLSFAIYFIGKMTGTLENAYGVSRKIAGGLQSLSPLMLIIPGWWLMKHNHLLSQNEK